MPYLWNGARCQLVLTNKKSYISFRLVPKSWPRMTLNGEMSLILRYFTEFGSLLVSGAHCLKVVDKVDVCYLIAWWVFVLITQSREFVQPMASCSSCATVKSVDGIFQIRWGRHIIVVFVIVFTEWPHKAGKSDIRSCVWYGQWNVHVYSKHYWCSDARVLNTCSEALCIVVNSRTLICRYQRFYC